MGMSIEAVVTDELGRRSSSQRQYSLAKKRAVIEEAQAPGAYAPDVAGGTQLICRRLYQLASRASFAPLTVYERWERG